MRRLMLLRHAKSDWSVPGRRDIDRPLNARGRDAAPRMGAYIAAHDLIPDRVLVSSAQRTRETWALVSKRFRDPPPAQFDPGIYEASAAAILAAISATPARVKNLLVVGHNPGFQDLALALVGSGDSEARARLASKFSTAGLAVIDFDVSRWSDLRPGGGALERFVTPRVLAEANP